jgi:hypothetical protein
MGSKSTVKNAIANFKRADIQAIIMTCAVLLYIIPVQPSFNNPTSKGEIMKIPGFNYNIEIMDILAIIFVSDFIVLWLMVKIAKMRGRIEALEKHLNIQPPK